MEVRHRHEVAVLPRDTAHNSPHSVGEGFGDANGEVAERVGCDVDTALTRRSRCIAANA